MFVQRMSLLLLSVLFLSVHASGATLEVGPGKLFTSIGQVPWENLQAGDTVLIHYRTNVYAEKFVLCRQGTKDAPIIIRGVPGPNGELPKISGENATTRTNLSYWGENRGVIKIGGANKPADTMPQFITIENLDIAGARTPETFIGANGAVQTYQSVAASIWIEKGANIVIRNCSLHDSSIGFFVSSSDALASQNILMEGCYVYGNGNTNSVYAHNIYTEALGITFQFNHFGPQRPGCLGNNLKDRSAGLIVRYNWIEGGSRELDLVDAEDSSMLRADPTYRSTYVYGNILIEPDADGSSQIVHYGGDSGITANYRKGKLFFYNNTVVSKRSTPTVLFHLQTDEEGCDAWNNIFYVTNSGNALALSDGAGVLNYSHNWMKSGFVNSFSAITGAILNQGGNIIATNSPGFLSEPNDDFHLTPSSVCIDAGGISTNVPSANFPLSEYVKHQEGTARMSNGPVDVGAFEFQSPLDIWRAAQFGTNAINPIIAGNSADPDGDGVNNFLEYAFCGDPLKVGTVGLPRSGIVSNGSNYLSISFVTRPIPAGILYTVQTSSNLTDWLNGPSFSDAGDVTMTVAARTISVAGSTNKAVRLNSPIGSAATTFMRVKVEPN